MKFYSLEPGKYPGDNSENKNDFNGNGWGIKKDGPKYILEYISGALEGKLKTHEVTQEDFENAKAGRMSLNDFCIKYNIS